MYPHIKLSKRGAWELLTKVCSEAIVTPFGRVVVSVVGAFAGGGVGAGSFMPGRGSVMGTVSRDEPPNNFESQPADELVASDSAGTALAATAVLKLRNLGCMRSPC